MLSVCISCYGYAPEDWRTRDLEKPKSDCGTKKFHMVSKIKNEKIRFFELMEILNKIVIKMLGAISDRD